MDNTGDMTQQTNRWGTPLQDQSKRLLLLGAGELGKEVAIEAMRLGIEVIAADTYPHAPAMQVALRSHVIDMLDGQKLRYIVEKERPTWIVPEVEAIDTKMLITLEQEGWQVIPTAQATRLTMDREGIRRLAAETLGLKTSPYCFAATVAEYQAAIDQIGLPCVVKPIMSSSGKGQSIVRQKAEIAPAWDYAQKGGRTRTGRVIVEGFIPFDTEITLLTVRSAAGTHFCDPIGHIQQGGDYRESWQPCPLHPHTLSQCQTIAEQITSALGGWGIFGVELFISGSPDRSQTVYFSEVSPRPHDTGMVTLISQNMSEFELHVRAITGLPIGTIETLQPSASAVILANCIGTNPTFTGLDQALQVPTSKVRLFGKPSAHLNRRMGVALALGDTIEEARHRAKTCAAAIEVGATPLVADPTV